MRLVALLKKTDFKQDPQLEGTNDNKDRQVFA
jgi:hypothetical protein